MSSLDKLIDLVGDLLSNAVQSTGLLARVNSDRVLGEGGRGLSVIIGTVSQNWGIWVETNTLQTLIFHSFLKLKG